MDRLIIGLAAIAFSVRIGMACPAPANDHFEARTNLGRALSASVQGAIGAATTEVGEPRHDDRICIESLWWSWTAPGDGTFLVSLDSSDFPEILAVYSGSDFGGLEPVASGIAIPTMAIDCVLGQTFQIVVATEGGTGAFRLDLAYAAATPTNDDFANRQDLGSPATLSFVTQTTGATTEPGEPSHRRHRSVWYSWTAPETGMATLTPRSNPIRREVIKVYQGDTLASLEEVTRLAVGRGTSFAAVEGEVYEIAIVDRNSSNSSGVPVRIDLTMTEHPPNDSFANAIELTQPVPLTVHGTITGAVTEPGEPISSSGGSGRGSVWYRWTAEEATGVTIAIDSGTWHNLISVYTGSEVGALERLWNRADEVKFGAQAGQVYHIAVSGQLTELDNDFELSFSTQGLHPNDDFSNAFDLGSESEVSYQGTTAISGSEPGLADPAGQDSVWLKWTAPDDLFVDIDLGDNRVGGSRYTVFSGEAVADLVPLSERSRFERWRFLASAGTTYHILVSSTGAPSDFDLGMRAHPLHPNDEFANAHDLGSGAAVVVRGDSDFATTSEGEPSHPSDPRYGTVWYRWNAPTDGSFEVAVFRSSPGGSEWAVFTRPEELGSLVELPNRNGFDAVEGESYWIAVISDYNSEFELVISSTAGPPPASHANDLIDSAIDLGSPPSLVVPGHSHFAMAEVTEPPGGQGRVWYRWSSPSDRLATLGIRTGNVVLFQRLPSGDLAQIQGYREFYAPAGAEFLIGVARSAAPFTLYLHSAPPRVSNDGFASAWDLGMAPQAVAVGSFAGATREAGEGRHSFAREAFGSLWFKWRAPETLGTRITFAGDGGFPLHAVYKGNEVDGLTEVAEVTGSVGASFRAEAGTLYWIALGSSPTSPPPWDYQLELQTFPLADNDLFANRQVLAGALPVQTMRTDNIGATSEPGEPEIYHRQPAATLWWQWTAVETGWVGLDARGSEILPRLAVFSGSSLANAEQVSTGVQRLAFEALAGETYQIAVDSSRDSERGSVEFVVGASSPTLNNDAFSNRLPLSGTDVDIVASNFGSGSQGSEPSHYGNAQTSVWWSWVAPYSGPLSFDLSGSDFDARLNLYRGDAINRLSRVSDTSSSSGTVEGVVAGETYQVAVAGFDRDDPVGVIRLRLAQPGVDGSPAHDDFSDRLDLGSAPAIVTPIAFGWPSREPAEPAHGNSIWLQWEAPAAGRFLVRTEGGGRDLDVHVYSGGALGELQLLASGHGAALFDANAATVYPIAITNPVGRQGIDRELDLVVEPAPPRPANDNFADVVTLESALPVSVIGTTVGANLESGEPAHGGDLDQGGSVWWSWTAPSGGEVVAAVDGGATPLNVAVYVGDSLLAIESAGGNETTGAAFFVAEAGGTYRIAVSSTGPRRPAPFVLSVSGSSPQTFGGWIASFFPAGSPETAPDADPDGDGDDNFAEYAFAGRPSDGATRAARSARVSSPDRLGISVRVPRTATDVDYFIDYSENSQHWRPAESMEGFDRVFSDNGDGTQTLSATIPLHELDAPTAQLRVVAIPR